MCVRFALTHNKAKLEIDSMPQGISVHIGLNSVDPRHYEGWDGKLTACEADAKDMQALAKKQKFSSSTLLLTRPLPRPYLMQSLGQPRRSSLVICIVQSSFVEDMWGGIVHLSIDNSVALRSR
jgi:hypothetical protein